MTRSRIAWFLLTLSFLPALFGSGDGSHGGVAEDEPFQINITSVIPLEIEELVRQGSYLYILDGINGFHVIDLSDPAYPRWKGVMTDFNGYRMTVSGDYAYISNCWGLHIVDIADPANPHIAAQYDGFESYQGIGPCTAYVAASNDRLFVELYYVVNYGRHDCLEGERVAVMDVSDPLRPQRIGTLLGRETAPIFAEGNVYYRTLGSSLDAFDARPPETTPLLSHLYFPEFRWAPHTGFAMRSDYALLHFGENIDRGCNDTSGESWHIVDIAEPRAPKVLLSESTGNFLPVHAGDGYFYVRVWGDDAAWMEIRRYPDVSVAGAFDDFLFYDRSAEYEGFIQAGIVYENVASLTTFRISAATETVDPAVGATLTYSDTLGITSFELAPGAVLSPTVVSALPLPRADHPPGGRPQCLAFDIRGHMPAEQRTLQRFQQPVTVTLPISPTQCAADSGPALGWEFLYWERDRWIDAAATCTDTVPNPAAQAMTGEDGNLVVHICRPGKYALYPVWLEHYLPASWFQPGWE